VHAALEEGRARSAREGRRRCTREGREVLLAFSTCCQGEVLLAFSTCCQGAGCLADTPCEDSGLSRRQSAVHARRVLFKVCSFVCTRGFNFPAVHARSLGVLFCSFVRAGAVLIFPVLIFLTPTSNFPHTPSSHPPTLPSSLPPTLPPSLPLSLWQ
jgi:hypothetical protein